MSKLITRDDFMFQEHYNGVVRVKMLFFRKYGVTTKEVLIDNSDLIKRIRESKKPNNQDLKKLKNIIKRNETIK
jgi:hypothetical protein